jgi:hypothetical protein
LETEADPTLDEMQQGLESVKENIDTLSQPDRPLSSSELGLNHSVPEAVDAVKKDDTKIKLDTERGENHHRRVHRVLRFVGRWSPWIEAFGFLAFVTYYLDVPLLQPWIDWFS